MYNITYSFRTLKIQKHRAHTWWVYVTVQPWRNWMCNLSVCLPRTHTQVGEDVQIKFCGISRHKSPDWPDFFSDKLKICFWQLFTRRQNIYKLFKSLKKVCLLELLLLFSFCQQARNRFMVQRVYKWSSIYETFIRQIALFAMK